jgi:DNA-directed RNA polymerase subunit K/omega
MSDLNFITKYEKTRIIGARAVQLSLDAVPTIDIGTETDVLKIAEMEFEQKMIPFHIIRTNPNGEKEIVNLMQS